MSRIIKKLKTEGKYEMASTNFAFEHASFPGQKRGEVIVSMSIVGR